MVGLGWSPWEGLELTALPTIDQKRWVQWDRGVYAGPTGTRNGQRIDAHKCCPVFYRAAMRRSRAKGSEKPQVAAAA
jgi:hypothetical protein